MRPLTRIARAAISRGAYTLLFALTVAMLSQQPAHAGLTWNWSFGGTESGTLQTNGTLADLAGPFNFAINGITVSASSAPALIGGSFYETMPNQGLLWDGTKVTQFYRSAGLYTNGSNFFSTTTDYFIAFYVDGSINTLGSLRFFVSSPYPAIDYTALTLITPTAVPEPSTLALSLAGLGAVAGITLRRRKAARG